MFSGSLKHPRYMTVLPKGKNEFLVRNGAPWLLVPMVIGVCRKGNWWLQILKQV